LKYDATTSEANKREGMSHAALAGSGNLEIARVIAANIAWANNGLVTMDDVGKVLDARGIEVGPWAGSVFKGASWEFTGSRVRSTRTSNNGRELKVWRWVGQ
jgi:hypothetical protein